MEDDPLALDTRRRLYVAVREAPGLGAREAQRVAGTAWGEWSARDFSRLEAREKMAQASHNMAPPVQTPRGLERLSSVWTAPFPQYAPSFVRRPAVGYALSAMFGSGAIILVSLIPGWLVSRKVGGRW